MLTPERFLPRSLSAFLVAVLIFNSLLFALALSPAPAYAQTPVTVTSDVPATVFGVLKRIFDTTKEVRQAAVDTKQQADSTWTRFFAVNGVLDQAISTLFVVMMHQVLAKITNDIVVWINGGGKGKIRVLQDPGKLLAESADEAGGVLAGAILNVDPKTLCDASYLKFKLKATFTGPYAVPTFDEKVACTFTGAAAGLQKFQEDFRNGGWASFIELARKENNQIGQTLIVNEELKKLEATKKETVATSISIHKGYTPQEKCTITKAVDGSTIAGAAYGSYVASGNVTSEYTADTANEAEHTVQDLNAKYGAVVGKTTDEAMKQLGMEGMSEKDFKSWWEIRGGEIKCKTVTPGEQISDLATKALIDPLNRLEESITGLTGKLGTNVANTLSPYLTAIANAGINLMMKKGIGLITTAITPSQKPRKARRQSTSSLQENTMLAQSAGSLVGSVNNFRSFLLKAMLEFNLFVSNAAAAIDGMDVLGRIPINRVEAEIRRGTWYFPETDCPPGYYGSGGSYASHFCNTTPAGPNTLTTNTAGKVFFEEAKWCGAYRQEVPIPTETPIVVTTGPLAGSNPIPLADLAGSCPTLTYFGGSAPGDCTDPSWVRYDLGSAAGFEMATRIVGYDDNLDDAPDRFIRQNIVGADASGDGVPDTAIPALDPANVTFSETLVDTHRDENRNALISRISTSTDIVANYQHISTADEVRELFEMRPNYANTVINTAGTAVISLPQGLAQAAVANDYVFGGYNQFGHSDKVFRLSTGALVASLPVALSGSAAVYYPPNGRIYLFGGFDSAKAYNTIWEFNPTNQTLRTMSARLPASVSGLAGAYYPPTGRIYLFGGATEKGPRSWILEYNQATDTLVTKNTALPSPLVHAAAAVAAKNPPNSQQRVFVFGGLANNGFSSNAIFEYDPAKSDDGFAPLTRKSADLGDSRGFIAAAVAAATPNIVTLISGQSEYGLLAAVEQYNAQTDSLTQMPLLAEPRSKGGGGIRSGSPVSAGGILPAGAVGNSKIFPEGDIYHIPASIMVESATSPFWEKYFSPKFENASTMLLNSRDTVSYKDFTTTIRDSAISSYTNTISEKVWMSPQFYQELFEKMQELMEKSRIIDGYNYLKSAVKNYQSGLADQLGTTPDDDPYDNNPSNPAYRYGNELPGIIEQNCVFPAVWNDAKNKCFEEGYKGSVTDALNKYNNLTQVYQVLFGGLADENALEGVDKDLKILSPTETNIKFALIGSRCPALPPSATSTPDLVAKCPKFGTEYNMARRFIFEADDAGANPTGITTGFATNPFTGEKSSALAGILNLDEMATQLQSLSPDKNIIKLIRLRQLLERLQVAPQPIPIPGKVDIFITPQPLSGVDTIQISLPGYEKIEKYLNSTSTVDSLGNPIPDKNRSIQTLIEDYGYTNAKDAYPEISKHLDEIFDTIVSQITDDLKETFLKRLEEQLEESKGIAQYRLHRFIEYVRDINSVVKLEIPKQRGDQLAGLSGVDVVQIDSESSVLRINTEDMFVNNGQRINVLLSRAPLRLTNDERNGIIGSSVYKIKTLAKFMGFDTTTAEFSTRMSQYFITTGGSEAEQNADLDRRVRNVLRDVYMYYTGIFSQTDEMLPPQKRNIVSSCGQDAILGYYCELTSIGANREKVKIFKDARTKLEELQNDFSLMVEETSKVSEEFQTLFSNITAQKQNLEDLVKLLSNLRTDYDQGNACVGIPTDASNLWKPTGTQAAIANLAPLNQVFKSNWFESIFGYYSRKARKKMQEEAERRERERQALLQSCRTGISNYNKHLGQLADQFVCNKTNPKYE